MWEHIQKTGSNPLDVLSADLMSVSPKTGMKFRGAARKTARDVKVSEKTGSTYVESKTYGTGMRFNSSGGYTLSAREAKRIKDENTAELRRQDAKRRHEDAVIAEMLAEQNELMNRWNKTNGY